MRSGGNIDANGSMPVGVIGALLKIECEEGGAATRSAAGHEAMSGSAASLARLALDVLLDACLRLHAQRSHAAQVRAIWAHPPLPKSLAAACPLITN